MADKGIKDNLVARPVHAYLSFMFAIGVLCLFATVIYRGVFSFFDKSSPAINVTEARALVERAAALHVEAAYKINDTLRVGGVDTKEMEQKILEREEKR